MPDKTKKPFVSRLRQYVITGLLVVLPLWVTWLVIDFLFGLISSAGGPWIRAFARLWSDLAPAFTQSLLNPYVQTICAFVFVLVVLYFLGWFASRVLGKQALAYFNSVVEQIPFVQTIYGSTRKLLAALQQKPSNVQRIVLIEFPTPSMKTVGLVTRTFQDADTGQELAAVYVPTTPNPTSGYLEIVPVKNLVSTDWTFDDAMSFIISGGAVGPNQINYSKSH
ncbi:MAG: DUF502 domain-containing protein [Acidobacteria bacterium]|nr:DUF502 domain-containing protein [Acidobacteriota bacterium]